MARDLYLPPVMPVSDPGDVDIDQILDLALRNNMLLHFAQVIGREYPRYAERVEPILAKGKKAIRSLRRAIDVTGDVLDRFIIIKTYRGDHFLRIANDLDVLVPMADYENARARFLGKGYRMVGDLPREMSVGFVREGMHKIHLHAQIAWCGSRFLGEDFVFRDTRTVQYLDRDIQIPGENADFLIYLAHCNYEPLHILLSELLYLYSIYPRTDLTVMTAQAGRYDWRQTFLRTVGIISAIHEILFGYSLASEYRVPNLHLEGNPFPYTFTTGHLIRAVMEKRIFGYVISRALKVVQLVITRNSQRFTEPPERNIVS